MEEFTGKKYEKAFVQQGHTDQALLQKELIVLASEETLLKQRIELMNQFINDLPSWDPQYNMMLLALEMDQAELESQEARKLQLLAKLSTSHDK